MDYEYVVRDLLNGEVPQVYNTIKTEQQVEENMMGVIRARTRKATVVPREYGPVNCYNVPVDLQGQPFRFPWSSEILRKMINASLRASPNVRTNYHFKFIQVANRYWNEPVGYPRARPLARGQEHLDHQFQHLDFARVPEWIEVAAQKRDRNLYRCMPLLQYDPVWNQQGKMTMTGDVPLVLLDMVNSVLGGESRAEWEEESLNLDVCNNEAWKRACGLGKQTGWVSMRVALAAACRAEAERALRYAPQSSQSTATPTMAMSLEHPLTMEAAPVQELAENTAMPVTPDQSGQHAAELTHNAALADPTGELTIDTTPRRSFLRQ